MLASRQALQRFLQHYERLSRHALAVLPARADLRIVLDAQRRVAAIVRRQPASSTTTAVP